MKKSLLLPVVFLSVFSLFAESEGEKFFLQNNPSSAVYLLENEIKNGTASSSAWNYLGLSYFQLGDFQKSVETFRRGLSVPGTNKKVLAFNGGNSAYAMKDYQGAIELYSLTLSADPSYTQALLNRANANLMNRTYEGAISDYETYLIKVPEDPQNPKIIELLALLRKELVRLEEEQKIQEMEAQRIAEETRRMEEEMARLAAEKAERDRLAKEEEERIAAEKRAEQERIEAERRAEEERIAAEKRALEAERRRRLLEDVANSLQDIDSTSMTSGAEDIIEYDQESELD